MGKRALAGLEGVIDVKNGWHRGREINTVVYDPEKITVEKMVQALKKAKTFTGIRE